MSEFEKLWYDFDNSEIDKLHIEKMNLCHKMMSLVDDGKKEEIQLELDIIWFVFGLRRILQDPKEVSREEFSSYIQLFKDKSNDGTRLLQKAQRWDQKSIE